MNVAETILSQLGGRRFVFMTGSTNFMNVRGEDALIMRLAPNKSGAEYLKIKLTFMDDYTMTFVKENMETNRLETVVEKERIYCDQLEEMFTEVTGLETKMPQILIVSPS